MYIYIILFIYYFSIYRIYTFKCYVRNYVRIMSQGGDRLKTIVLIHIYIYICMYIYIYTQPFFKKWVVIMIDSYVHLYIYKYTCFLVLNMI